MQRAIKILIAASSSAFCILYALQNVANLQAAHDFVALVAGMQGHESYAQHFGPAVSSPALTWLMLRADDR